MGTDFGAWARVADTLEGCGVDGSDDAETRRKLQGSTYFHSAIQIFSTYRIQPRNANESGRRQIDAEISVIDARTDIKIADFCGKNPQTGKIPDSVTATESRVKFHWASWTIACNLLLFAKRLATVTFRVTHQF